MNHSLVWISQKFKIRAIKSLLIVRFYFKMKFYQNLQKVDLKCNKYKYVKHISENNTKIMKL